MNIHMSKVCTKCKQIKHYYFFSKCLSNKDGLQTKCKECKKIESKNWRKNNPEYIKNHQINNKEIYLKRAKQWELDNKEHVKQRNKQHYDNNKERYKQNAKTWFKNNSERAREYLNQYNKELRQNPTEKIKQYLRIYIGQAFKETRNNKYKSTLEVIGLISWDEFRKYIESLWVEGMNWGNYGIGANNTTWYIDHIIPISLAKTEEDIYKLNHYTNLRPMWGSDNIRKSNKCLED